MMTAPSFLNNATKPSFLFKGEGENLIIKEVSEEAFLFAKRCLKLAKNSGRKNDFLSRFQAVCSFRILWMMREGECFFLNEGASIEIPKWCLDLKETEDRMEDLSALGFNALLLGISKQATESKNSFDFEPFIKILKRYSIKLILNVSLESCQTKEEIQFNLPDEAALFWEAGSLNAFMAPSESREFLQSELLLKEVSFLLDKLGDKREIFFYLKEGSLGVKAVKDFCLDLPANVTVVFSEREGLPWEDHHLAHSFWDELSKSRESLGVPLIPIINSGGVNQGSGLWPNLAFNGFDEFQQKKDKQFLKGVISISHDIPKPGSLLDLALFYASSYAWGISSRAILEGWLLTYSQIRDTKSLIKELERVREIIVNYSEVKSIAYRGEDETIETSRLILYEMISKINRLQKSISSYSSDSKIAAYFSFFVRDLKFFINSHAGLLKIPARDLWQNQDKSPSFFTDNKFEENNKKNSKPHFLKKPNLTLEDPEALRILKESRWV